MEASGTAFGGLKPPSAFWGIDFLYGENPHKPWMRVVSTPSHPGDPVGITESSQILLQKYEMYETCTMNTIFLPLSCLFLVVVRLHI